MTLTELQDKLGEQITLITDEKTPYTVRFGMPFRPSLFTHLSAREDLLLFT